MAYCGLRFHHVSLQGWIQDALSLSSSMAEQRFVPLLDARNRTTQCLLRSEVGLMS